MTKANGGDYISIEKKKNKRYFILLALSFVLMVLVLSIATYLFTFYPPLLDCLEKLFRGNSDIQKKILFLFPPILAAITALIFAIPWQRDDRDYPISKRRVVLFYLIWMIFNILFPLFVLVKSESLSVWEFNLGVLLFIVSLIVLIPYVLMFSHSNRYSILMSWYRIASFPFVFAFKKITEKVVEKTKRSINSIRQLIIQAIKEYDRKVFSEGLEKIKLLGALILESKESGKLKRIGIFFLKITGIRRFSNSGISASKSNIDEKKAKLKDGLIKVVLHNHLYIATECVRLRWGENMNKIVSNTVDLIKQSMRLKDKVVSKAIDYPIYVDEVKSLGILSIENNLVSPTMEIIDSLGQISEYSLNLRRTREFDNPPDIKVLESLQAIGIECSKKRYESSCHEVLVRIESIADMAHRSIAREAEEGKKEGDIKEIIVLEEALKAHWIISAHIFENIPEAKEWLKPSVKKMEEEFGKRYAEAYRLALEEMGYTSSIGKKVLLDYKKRVRRIF
jgi:hypothetical protein